MGGVQSGGGLVAEVGRAMVPVLGPLRPTPSTTVGIERLNVTAAAAGRIEKLLTDLGQPLDDPTGDPEEPRLSCAGG